MKTIAAPGGEGIGLEVVEQTPSMVRFRMDDRAHGLLLVFFGPIQRIAHIHVQLRAHRIALFWPVENEPGYAIFLFDFDCFVIHLSHAFPPNHSRINFDSSFGFFNYVNSFVGIDS